MDKNQSMLDFLMTCPTIVNSTLFFNFGNIEDNAYQAITRADEVLLNRPYIDGSVAKRYTFSIDSFKAIAYNPIVQGYLDENVEDFNNVQTIIDWINSKGDEMIFPNFGENCVIDSMKTLTTKPTLMTVDNSTNPPIAIYRISIQIDYIDYSKCIWK